MTVRTVVCPTDEYLARVRVPLQLFVDPFLPTASITLLFGPPSAGKSMFLTTLALSLANGTPLFGKYPTKPARVLMVQADMPDVLYAERLRMVTSQPFANTFQFVTDAMPFNVLNGSARAALVAAAAFTPDIVFVDVLRKTHVLDENESSAADAVYGAWRSLFPGAAFVFSHHARKVPADVDSEDVIVREAFRGNTAWAAGADTLLMLRKTRHASWTTVLNFVRTRSCEEPDAVLLTKTDEMLLELVGSEAERRLLGWLKQNARATQADAVKWLLEQRDEAGKPLCGQRTAYRIFERLSRDKTG